MKKRFRFLIGSTILALVVFVAMLSVFAFTGKAKTADYTSNEDVSYTETAVETTYDAKYAEINCETENQQAVSGTETDDMVLLESNTSAIENSPLSQIHSYEELASYEDELYLTAENPDGTIEKRVVEKPNASNTMYIDVDDIVENYKAQKMAEIPDLATAYAGSSTTVSGFSYNAGSYYYTGGLGSARAYGYDSDSGRGSLSSSTTVSDTMYIYIRGDLNTARSYGRLTGYFKWNWYCNSWGEAMDEGRGETYVWGCVSWSACVYNQCGGAVSASNYSLWSNFQSNDYIAIQAWGRARASRGWSIKSRSCSGGIDMQITTAWCDFYFTETGLDIASNTGGYIEYVSDWSLGFYEQSVIYTYAYAGYYFNGWTGWYTGSARAFWTLCGFQYSSNPWYRANWAGITIYNNGANFTYNGGQQGPTASAGGWGVTNYYNTAATDSGCTTTMPTNVGTYYHRCIVNGDSGYGYTNWTQFTIQPKNLSGNTTIGYVGTQTYSGNAYTPQPSLKDNARNCNLSSSSDFSYSYSNNVNAGTATVTMTGKGNYTGSVSVNFTINKATPELSSVSATNAITYGQVLSNSGVTGTAKNEISDYVVEGSWKFTNGSTMPAVSDSNNTNYEITFTPNSSYSGNYNSAVANCKITVNKATPVITSGSVSATNITYGQTLASSAVSGSAYNPYNSGMAVYGSWSFADSNTIPNVKDNSGKTYYTVRFYPNSNYSGNYNTVDGSCTLVVQKAVPNITATSADAITFESALVDATISGTASNYHCPNYNIPGSYYWYTPSQAGVVGYTDTTGRSNTILDKISNTVFIEMPEVYQSGTYNVVFIPNDTDSYVSTCTTAKLTVNPKAQNLAITPLDQNNATVSPEAIATKSSGYARWADYQVEVGREITITAYTDAIYPTTVGGVEKPRKIIITIDDADLATLGTAVYAYETIGGKTYSKVTITLTTLNSAGIVKISANQYDNVQTKGQLGYSVDNLGDYQNATTFEFRLYVKQVQYSTGTFNNEKYAKEYGDSSFEIAPLLNSEFKDYTISSSDANIVSIDISDIDNANRTATIKNAGTVTLTLSHPGYVDPGNPANAWMNFEETATVTVSPITLQVAIESVSITYGDTPIFKYLYYGFKYNDAFTVPVSVESINYTEESMHDVLREGNDPEGAILSYTIKPLTAINTGDYENYVFEYLPSTLTINPKTLVATLKEASKTYGSVTPDFPISYEGFVRGEDVDTANVDSYPTVNYGETKSNQFQTIGDYEISINSDGVSSNYTFETSDVVLLHITPADVVIAYEPWDVDFDGKTHFQDAIFNGVEGGLKPANIADADAITYRYSTDGNNWTAELPVLANSYDVEITFTCVEGDNYQTTTLKVSAGLTVNQIDPTITIEPALTAYNAYNITLPAEVTGVDETYVPVGTIQYFYSNSKDPNNFDVIEPKDVEVYSIKVVYTHGANDNYHDFTIVFENILEIEKVDAIISLAQKFSEYGVEGGAPRTVKANEATVKGYGTDVLPTDDGARFSYEYLINGEFTKDLPYNAGNYQVKVTYTADADSNYNTTVTLFNAAVAISKASLYDSIELEYLESDYTGELIAPSAATYFGLEAEGGSAPTGTISYSFRITGSGASFVNARGRTDANEYSVRVSYISNDNDNYASCNKEFEKIFVIRQVAPTITFNSISAYNYNGNSYTVEAVVTGTPMGTTPSGTITYEYYVDGTWVTYGPYNAGKYDVRATYTSITGDNYASTTTDSVSEYLVINKVAPSLSINFMSSDYTGNPIVMTTSLANVRGALYDLTGPQGSLSYSFLKAGETEWTTEIPRESGAYDVMVTYTAIAFGMAEQNYKDTERTFLNAVIINNIAPTITLAGKTVTYSGEQVAANEPKINQSSGTAYGKTTVEYRVNNQWTTLAPVNAGSYQVRVIYRAAAIDNYKSHSETFANALVIKPLAIDVVPEYGQYKIYDGKAPDGTTITFEAEKLVRGNVWTGNLEAGTNSTVGSYEITQGTLSAGNNYTINFEQGIMYRIKQKEVQLVFPKINSVYDGNYKEVKISVNPASLVGNDAVTVFTNYEGDYKNVGTFKAVAVMAEKNYTLPIECSKEYEITPARMAGNTFVGYEAKYDGKAHPLTITTMMDGASVTYDSPTSYVERGSYTVIATVSKDNYYDEELSATLTIVKGQYNVKVFSLAETYYYGDDLPSIKTDCDNYGKAKLDETQTLTPGQTAYSWTFIPNDPENYNVTTGYTNIDVAKAVAEFTVRGPLSQSMDSPEALSAFATNGVETYETTITYTDNDGNVYYSRPTVAGRYTMTASFSGNELYEAAEYSTILTIEESVDLWWVWLVVGIVALLGTVSFVFFLFKKRTAKR